MDKKILLTFHRFSKEHPRFAKAASSVSRISPFLFFAVYVSAAVFLSHGPSNKIILFAAVPFVNLAISYVLRFAIKRERPYTALNLDVNYAGKKSYSFPSNHSASAAIIGFACLSVNEYLGIIVFILAIFTGLSRIFTAMHYPSDVCAGFIQSAIVAIIGFNIVPTFFM